MDRKKRYFIILVLFLILNLFIHNSLFLHYSNIENSEKIVVPNGAFLKIALPDYVKPFAADILWIKLTNNININKRDKETGEKLYKYMMIVTDLDTYFYIPYLLGGSFLPLKNGYNLFDEGITLLKKGIKYLPNKWQLTFLTGYFYFFEHNDKETGYKYFEKCLTLKSTPDNIKKLIPLATLHFSDKSKQIKKLKELMIITKDKNIRKFIENILKKYEK